MPKPCDNACKYKDKYIPLGSSFLPRSTDPCRRGTCTLEQGRYEVKFKHERCSICPKDCIHQQFSFLNGDLVSYTGVENKEACQKKCQANDQCGLFVYATGGAYPSTCWLKCALDDRTGSPICSVSRPRSRL